MQFHLEEKVLKLEADLKALFDHFNKHVSAPASVVHSEPAKAATPVPAVVISAPVISTAAPVTLPPPPTLNPVAIQATAAPATGA